MTPVELLQALEKTGVSLTIQGDKLKVDAPAGLMTFEMRNVLAANKTSLMALLAKRHNGATQLPLADATPAPADRTHWDAALDARIAQARAERDALAARFDKGADYLETMQARGESATAEFERLFAAWEQINSDYKAAEDRLATLELTAQIRQNHIQNSR